MIEIVPNVVDTALLYFHTRCSMGDEIAPFVGAATELYKVFKSYGVHAEGVILSQGQGKPDEYMFREAIQQIKTVLG